MCVFPDDVCSGPASNSFKMYLMQYGVINNKFTRLGVLVFSMTVTVTANAANNVPSANQKQYYLAQNNPWQVPRPPENEVDFQRLPKYRSQQYQGDQSGYYSQGQRFVTPEILESLKQQQIQNQLLYRPYWPQRQQPMQQNNNMDYAAPSYGGGYADPLYDTPAVSPWSNGADMLYRGQSMPWVPDAAIGGIPPVHITPLDNTNGFTVPGDPMGGSVFNPFNFAPNNYGE